MTVGTARKYFRLLLLTGLRQVGKTTLLQKLAEPERKIVSFWIIRHIAHLPKTDPELFLQRYTPPVLIDEVRYAPELFPYNTRIIVISEKHHLGFLAYRITDVPDDEKSAIAEDTTEVKGVCRSEIT